MPATVLRLQSLVLALALTAVGCADRPGSAVAPSQYEQVSVVSGPVVELTYLANEGVLLRAGDDVAVIDGLHRFYREAYAVLPDAERLRLERAEGDYRDVDVIVATHRHGDHFSPVATVTHLAANPDALFYGAPQLIDELRGIPGADGVADRAIEVAWVVGESHERRHGNIVVELLGLRHAGEQHGAVHNLGVIVTLGGQSFLHVGDAAPDAANFAPFDLPARKLTGAIVPAWMVGSDSSRAVVREVIGARHVFIAHIDPSTSSDRAARLAASFPGATALSELLSTYLVRPESVAPR